MKYDLEEMSITLNDGRKLCVEEIVEINRLYQKLCTAEYIKDMYKLSDEEAIAIAEIIRALMDKYKMSEEEVIYKVFSERRKNA